MVQSWTQQLPRSFCAVLATRCGANEQKSEWFMSQRSLLELLLVLDAEWPFQIHLAKLRIWNLPNVPFQMRPCVLPQIKFIQKIKSTIASFRYLNSHYKKWVSQFWVKVKRLEQQIYCPLVCLFYSELFSAALQSASRSIFLHSDTFSSSTVHPRDLNNVCHCVQKNEMRFYFNSSW